MADEAPVRRTPGPEPASDAKKHANKRVVLSSVAKIAPENEGDSLLGEPAPPIAAAKPGTPELPPKTPDGLIRPVGWTTRPGGTTTIIKLPPKTGTLPRMMSLSPKAGATPPTLPEAGAPPVPQDEPKRPAPIKLEAAAPATVNEQESIFAPGPASEIKAPAAGERIVEGPEKAALGNASRAEQAGPAEKGASIEKAPVRAPARVLPPPLPRPEPARVPHVPRLLNQDQPSRETDLETPLPAPHQLRVTPPVELPKIDPLAQTVKLAPAPIQPAPVEQVPASTIHPAPEPAQSLLPLAETPGSSSDTGTGLTGLKADSPGKHRLPPRSSATRKLRAAPTAEPPKVFPAVAPAASAPAPPDATPASPAPPLTIRPQPVKSSITPPTIPMQPGHVKPPTIPLRPAPTAFTPTSSYLRGKAKPEEDDAALTSSARAIRKRRRRTIGIVVFYVLLVVLLPVLYETALYFTHETRVEGQVIPPPGTLLGNEVWIVTDFRDMAKGIADDLAQDRQIVLQDMQEKLGHVQRVQADIATREARIRLLKDQIQADNDEQLSLMKQARSAAQQIWNGPGAEMENEYQTRLQTLNQAIAQRARANRLAYNPDPNYFSPEVWANAYRLALYEVPAGVDAVKERTWLDAQMKAWHDFTKGMDQKQNDLREQAAQLKLAPAPKVADLKAQIEDLQQRIDATMAEEEPLKAELDQARADLSAVQAKEARLDAKPFEMLDALPAQKIATHLPLDSNGRFSWRELEKENTYAADERAHVFWVFARAFRPDGRQFWSLNRFTVEKDSTTMVVIEPNNFISTRAILRPDLSPDEQAQ